MPTVFRKNGFRFFFYSNEHDPVHIHVEGQNGVAKFNLFPVELVSQINMKSKDLKGIEKIVEEEKYLFLEKWIEYFGE